VEIDRLHLDISHGRVEIRGLTVASPFEALQNLLQADLLVADLEPLPLLEKKVVIDRLAATGLPLRHAATDGTVGRSDGRRDSKGRSRSGASNTGAGPAAHHRQDRRRSLDPAQLNTPRLATALAGRADSARQAWEAGLNGLGTGPPSTQGLSMVDR